jgi:uncharacterized RDD family membrane protein YckC
VAWYAAGRFATEFLRHDYIGKTEILGLYASQLIELGAIVAAAGVMGWLLLTRKGPHTGEAQTRLVRDREPPAGFMPAGIARRTSAFVLDTTPVITAAALAQLTEGRLQGVIWVGGGLLYVVVQILPARTPGMACLGLTWVGPDGRPASPLRRLVRAVLLPVSLATLIAIFRPLASSTRQGLYDMVAGIYVQSCQRSTILPDV